MTIHYDQLKLFVLDVDGVMTDGGILLGADGEELKRFNVKDGSGIKYWLRTGGQVAIITGRQSPVVDRRAGEVGITHVRQNAKDKLPVFQALLGELDLQPEQAAVMGDDITDLPCLMRAGFSACPADAVEEVKQRCDYVCRLPGGAGCVRETIELVLKATGRWETVMQRYLPAEGQASA